MKKLPKSISILGTKVKIRYFNVPLAIDGRDVWGFYDPNNRLIAIDGRQETNAIWETLLHEVGHAIFDLSGVNVTSLSPDVQEVVVEQFSRFIYANFDLRSRRRK